MAPDRPGPKIGSRAALSLLRQERTVHHETASSFGPTCYSAGSMMTLVASLSRIRNSTFTVLEGSRQTRPTLGMAL